MALALAGLAEVLLPSDNAVPILLFGGLLVFQALVIYLSRARSVEMAGKVYLWGNWLVVNLLYVVSDGHQSTAAYGQVLLVVVAGLISTPRAALWMALGSIGVNFGWYMLSMQGVHPPLLFNTSAQVGFVGQATGMLMAVALISIFYDTFSKYLQRIEEDELTFRALFERTSDMVFLIDLNFNFLDVNNRTTDLLGYAKKSLIGTPMLSIIAPEERDEAMTRFHQVRATGSLLPAQLTLVRANGQRRIAELNLALVRNANGQASHYQSTGRDVTDITQENLRLKTSLADLSVQASTDALTGILNRRVILDHAKAEWERHQREQRPLSMMMVDMTGLKRINDQFGHAAGDAALQRLADVLRANKRQYDWLGRYGGDEFLLVLPGADEETAQEVASRIQRSLENEFLMLGGKPYKLGASAGVSATDLNGNRAMSVDQLIDLADQSLYEAKRGAQVLA